MDAQDLVTIISNFLAYSGVVIIAYGGIVALYGMVLRGLKRSSHRSFTHVRGDFARKIIFGLDFLIASDIVKTILTPDINEVIVLGGIVVIRTVLTFLLSKETADLRREEELELASQKPQVP
ncbi:MAG: DUF1622 domain-containing protein [Methanomassiliicoccus sp.]|nr:DUF1622 domain-containing protein [Methanomassiliicoccus sp.]